MGAAVGSLGSCFAWMGCLGAQSCASGCNQAGAAGEKPARITFLVLFLFSAALAVFMKEYGTDLMTDLGTFDGACTRSDCIGNQAIYRVSFANVIFFAFMAATAPFCKMMQTQLWQAKVPAYFLMVIGAFFLPNEFFGSFEQAARYFSIMFLLLQVIIMVEFAYDCHEKLVKWADASDPDPMEGATTSQMMCNKWRIIYIAACSFFSLFWIVGCALQFAYFECSFARGMTAIACAGGLVCIAGSCCSKTGGWLPGATVAAYATWLNGSALSSFDDACNPARASTNDQLMWWGIVFAVVSMCYTAYSVSTAFVDAFNCCELVDSSSDVDGDSGETAAEARQRAEDERFRQIVAGGGDGGRAEGLEMTEPKMDGAESKAVASGSTDLERGNGGGDDQITGSNVGCHSASFKVFVFHMTLLTSGFYMAMILTNWADLPGSNEEAEQLEAEGKRIALGVSNTSMWVKLVCQWLTLALYLWTIIAQFLFPDRDFSDNH